MTLTERTNDVLAKLREIAECKGIPAGPWTVTGCDKHTNKDMAYVKVRGTVPGFKWQIADVRFIETENWSEQKEAEKLGCFIARSRTSTPAMAKALIVAIEGLVETGTVRQAMAQSGHDFFIGGAQRAFPLLCNANDALHSMLKTLEDSL